LGKLALPFGSLPSSRGNVYIVAQVVLVAAPSL